MKGLSLYSSTESFFSKMVDTAISNQELMVPDELRYYLVTLLSSNAGDINVLNQFGDASYNNTPLAILYMEALNGPLAVKRTIFKFVGDHSLYIAGYFADSLNGKIIDPNYYVLLGANAFDNLSRIASSSSSSILYSQIFENFSCFVDILTEVSFDTFMSSSEDLMRLYDRWLRTGSRILERKLMEKGIITPDKILIT